MWTPVQFLMFRTQWFLKIWLGKQIWEFQLWFPMGGMMLRVPFLRNKQTNNNQLCHWPLRHCLWIESLGKDVCQQGDGYETALSPRLNLEVHILVWSLGSEDPLEKGTATHSSVLAWRIPMDRGAWQVQSMGSKRVGRDWSDLAHSVK